MGFFSDFWYGFLKPIRDLAGSMLIYSLFASDVTISSTIQNSKLSFNIWLFLVIFIGMSSFLEMISEMIDNTDSIHKKPIDSFLRISGFIIGTFCFSIMLILIYVKIGGDFRDVIICEIIGSICMFTGMIIQMYYHAKPRKE